MPWRIGYRADVSADTHQQATNNCTEYTFKAPYYCHTHSFCCRDLESTAASSYVIVNLFLFFLTLENEDKNISFSKFSEMEVACDTLDQLKVYGYMENMSQTVIP